MEIVPSFNTLEAFRAMASPPNSEVSSLQQNSSHFQELYQNLPQLQKAIILPITYRSYETQHPPPITPYMEQRQPTISPSYYYNRLHASTGKHHYGKHRQENGSGPMMHKRNGYGYEDGPMHHPSGGGGGGGGHGSSPALSALALLGFMFFLQLIQNSLQNNRQLLAATALNATTIGVIGRGNRYGPKRSKRAVDDDNSVYPIPPTEYFNSYNIQRLGSKENKLYPYNVTTAHAPVTFQQKEKLFSNPLPVNTKLAATRRKKKIRNDPLEILKSSSIHCCQLIACKLGESIYDNLDKTTGFMLRMMGTTMIPRIPKHTWTGRLLRAVDRGWKKETCDSLYKDCGVLYNLFHSKTKSIQFRRPKKQTKTNKVRHYK